MGFRGSMNIKKIYSFEKKSHYQIPFIAHAIQAGFPSPADDYVDRKLDLNELLITHPAATFFVRVEGDSMIDAGIQSGDMLVVNRAIHPSNNAIVVAIVNNELTVKRMRKQLDKIYLVSENPDFQAIEITQDTDFAIWGVVTYVIHQAT
jgi:DNA polymerase V